LRTYRLLARRGPGAFYAGPLAQAIVDAVQRPSLRTGATRAVRPGVMTLADLAAYRAVDRATDPPSAQHIGAATGIELVGRGLILAAAEPFRRGGGSALVARPAGTPNR
jgi:Gamma-glutamyltranspeptidase